MSDILEAFRTNLELEAQMLETPGNCTINRALELAADAYQLGNQESDERKLREQYAGMAMQALLSSHYREFIVTSEKISKPEEEIAANIAVDFANALIKELRKEV